MATALTLMITLFAVNGSGAAAQSESFIFGDSSAASAQKHSQFESSQTESAPQFVSEPVVQALPEPMNPATLREADSLHALVAAISPEEQLSGDLHCLAQAIYFEARGEELSGQLAVARVIMNRTQSPLFPDSYCSVITQPAQFSFVRKGRIPQAPEHSRAWHRAKAIAHIAHDELWESEAQDALFFHADYVRPTWARTKLARATIDSHIFYR